MGVISASWTKQPRCWLADTQRSKVRDAVDESQDGFYEVAFGTRPDTLLVISRTSATVIDIAVSLPLFILES